MKLSGSTQFIGGSALFIGALLAACVSLTTQPAAGQANPPTPSAAGKPTTLKDAYAGHFLIGTALDFRTPEEFNEVELKNIKDNFNVITPENSMKPGVIHPQENTWNWEEPDRLVDFCQKNNIALIGHNLCWHQQTGNWFFVDENNQPVTKEKLLERFKAHIMTEVGHFKGKIKGWDVVNEAINDSGPGDTENLRVSNWSRIIGPDFLTYAFKWAHEADPAAELHYNDYNIEKGNKHASSVLLLKRLIADGAPITAVGIQGHWGLNNLPYADLDKAIDDYKALGLKVMITELDVTITGQGGGQFNAAGAPPGAAGGAGGRGFGRGAPAAADASAATAPATAPAFAGGPPTTGPAATGPAVAGGFGRRGRGGGGGGGGAGRGRGAPPTAEQLQAQADAYAKLFEIFEKHKDVVTRVTFWGVNDTRSWRAGQAPLVFDANNQPKPAFFSVLNVVNNPSAVPAP